MLRLSSAVKVKNLSKLDTREKHSFRMLMFIYSVFSPEEVSSLLISYFLHIYFLAKNKNYDHLLGVGVCGKLGRQLFKPLYVIKK